LAKLLKRNIAALLKSLLTTWLEDFFIFLGITIVLFTTYQMFGVNIGNYSLGFVLVVMGFVLAKK
jgi:hypothetical protein